MDIISQEEKYAQIADQIVARTYEVYSYDTNIENYLDALLVLPSEWPDHLLPLKGMSPHDAAGQCSLEDIELLSDLQQYDRINYLIRTETLERNKAKKILDVLVNKIPEDIRQEEVDKAILRRKAALGI